MITRKRSAQASAKSKPSAVPPPWKKTSGSPLPIVCTTVFTPSTVYVSRVNLLIAPPVPTLFGCCAQRRLDARAQPRDHLFRHQREVLHSLPVRHVGHVHHAIDVVGLHPLRPLADLVGDLVGSADSYEERLADGLEVEAPVHLVGHGGTLLELVHREISGRGQVLRR